MLHQMAYIVKYNLCYFLVFHQFLNRLKFIHHENNASELTATNAITPKHTPAPAMANANEPTPATANTTENAIENANKML